MGRKIGSVRVALTRLVAAGDLARSADGYRLTDRLLTRQRSQDEALDPADVVWDGTWWTLVLTTTGLSAATRGQLRTTLAGNRFAELREGVWLRPATAAVPLPPQVTRHGRLLRSRDEDAAGLAATLWDLTGWAATAAALLAEYAAAAGVAHRFTVAAAMVRHLRTDPVLPAELLPADWPGARLRTAYRSFAAELAERRAPALRAAR